MESWNASPRNQAIRHAKQMMLAKTGIQEPHIQEPTHDRPNSAQIFIAENRRMSPQKDVCDAHAVSRPDSPCSPHRNVSAAPVVSTASVNCPASPRINVSSGHILSPPTATSPASPQRQPRKETILLVSTQKFLVQIFFFSFSVHVMCNSQFFFWLRLSMNLNNIFLSQ